MQEKVRIMGNKRIKIIADMHIPFLKGVLEEVADVVYLPWQEMNRHNLRDADALITRTRTLCNRDLLEGSRVKMIYTASIGYDHIDTVYCEQNGIAWSNAPGCNSTSVEQYLLSSLIYLAGKYDMGLKDLTIGIVGVGYVGSKVARISRALGMNVLLNDPPRERAEGPSDSWTGDSGDSGRPSARVRPSTSTSTQRDVRYLRIHSQVS